MAAYRRGRPIKYNAIENTGTVPPNVVGEYRIRYTEIILRRIYYMRNNLAHNIKALRRYIGETQEELANGIGLESKASISQYENGKRYPNDVIIERIAKRYKLTVEELVYGDLSNNTLSNERIDNKILVQNTMVIFPALVSEDAMEDALFVKGYENHQRIFSISQNATSINENVEKEVEDCIRFYKESVDKNKTCESAANLTALLILLFASYDLDNRSNGFSGIEELFHGGMSLQRFVKNLHYPNVEKSLIEKVEFQRDWKSMMEEIDEPLWALIKIVKKSKQKKYADYLIALRYLYNVVDNEYGFGMNKSIGIEMMKSFAWTGNKYAGRWIKQILKYVKPDEIE